MKVRVYHALYGCDTGCCGHVFEIDNDKSHFEFAHPYGSDLRTWALKEAQALVRRRWPECYDSIDWESIDVEDVSDS